MNLELNDHVAVVVGGASGIGLSTARAFATEGAQVSLWDRSESVLQTAEALATEFAVPVTGVVADVTDENAIQQALGQT
ncbi:MAG TPA: SDR family NAD(P)-dependent oxidoreductase, partial [Planctomycetaceae bacterium]|nr:SDR family NAD(P)-dependent oxidoreductase [Planctomycetaceae bacterium]